MRLFLLFALFVTVPINSYIYIPSYGLFGELKTLAVADEYYSNYPNKNRENCAGRWQNGGKPFAGAFSRTQVGALTGPENKFMFHAYNLL